MISGFSFSVYLTLKFINCILFPLCAYLKQPAVRIVSSAMVRKDQSSRHALYDRTLKREKGNSEIMKPNHTRSPWRKSALVLVITAAFVVTAIFVVTPTSATDVKSVVANTQTVTKFPGKDLTLDANDNRGRTECVTEIVPGGIAMADTALRHRNAANYAVNADTGPPCPALNYGTPTAYLDADLLSTSYTDEHGVTFSPDKA